MEFGVFKGEWLLYGSGPEIIRAFEEKKIDMAYIGLPPALGGIERGLDIVCIAGGHVEGTVIAGRGRSYDEIEDAVKQLEGKRVGVPSKGSIHDVILREIRRKICDFDIVNYNWADLILEDFIEGEIDAICGTPNLAILASKFGARIFVHPSKLFPFNPSYGIVVKRELVEDDRMMDFLIKHEWACNLIKHSPDVSSDIIFRAYNGLLSKRDIEKILVLSPKYCASLPSEYVNSTLLLADIMRDLGYLESKLSEEEIFYRDLIEIVHPFPHHYSLCYYGGDNNI